MQSIQESLSSQESMPGVNAKSRCTRCRYSIQVSMPLVDPGVIALSTHFPRLDPWSTYFPRLDPFIPHWTGHPSRLAQVRGWAKGVRPSISAYLSEEHSLSSIRNTWLRLYPGSGSWLQLSYWFSFNRCTRNRLGLSGVLLSGFALYACMGSHSLIGLHPLCSVSLGWWLYVKAGGLYDFGFRLLYDRSPTQMVSD